MKILALEREQAEVTGNDLTPFLEAEAEHAWELYQKGLFRELYFDQRQHTAVIVMECVSVPEAAQVLSTLPLVKAGLISFELIPLAPYNGFERLFFRDNPPQ
jgi:hypothetical protein